VRLPGEGQEINFSFSVEVRNGPGCLFPEGRRKSGRETSKFCSGGGVENDRFPLQGIVRKVRCRRFYPVEANGS